MSAPQTGCRLVRDTGVRYVKRSPVLQGSALLGARDKKNCHSLIYHPHPLPIRVGIIIHSLPAGIQRLPLNNLPQAVSDRLRKYN